MYSSAWKKLFNSSAMLSNAPRSRVLDGARLERPDFTSPALWPNSATQVRNPCLGFASHGEGQLSLL